MPIKVKKKSGGIIENPVTIVKNILKTVGFSGGLLIKATNNTFEEAKRLAEHGVISATNFEKAVVRAVSNTNKIAMNTTQKITRKVLK